MTLITVAALALLGMVLAYWTWAWLAPPDEPQAQLVTQTGDPAASGLFGRTQNNGNSTASTGYAITLLGIVADANESGYAVLRLDAKETIAVHKGGEIEPGLQLVEVHADHIVMERGGARESLAWPDPGKSTAAVVPRRNKQFSVTGR